jgi:hypothetical protein
MASGAGVVAPIRAGKLVARACALNDYREFTLMRIVNGARRIQVAFDQSSLDGVEPTNAAAPYSTATRLEVFLLRNEMRTRFAHREPFGSDPELTSPQESSRPSAPDWRVIFVAVAPKKMHAEVQETDAPPSGQQYLR